MIRNLDHNEEQIVWAEQTEIEHNNFLKEFDETVWPAMKDFGYTKDAALLYWMLSHVNNRLDRVETAIRDKDEETF